MEIKLPAGALDQDPSLDAPLDQDQDRRTRRPWGAVRTFLTPSGGTRVAYQVVGDGPIDLVFTPGFASHIELQWADPSYARFLKRLASFSRLIVFDPRGAGASDRVAERPSLEGAVEDMLAVMDASGSERAAILGFSAGGSAAALLAATHPERCSALILCEAAAKGTIDPVDRELPSYEIEQMRDRSIEVVEHWGEGRGLELFAPSLAGSAFHRRSFGLFERASISRERLMEILRMFDDLDIRHILGSITAPTLVLHRRDDFVPISHGRYLSAHIAGARFVELEGADHLPYAGDATAIVREVEAFLATITGEQPTRERTHAALLFTDIVASTQRVVELGDERWRDLFEMHAELSRAEVANANGTVVKSTGDGVFAVFDSATRAVRSAWAIREQVHRLGLDVRAGVHAGDCEIVGDDLAGVAVHIASRVMSTAKAGQVLVSREAAQLTIGTAIPLKAIGERQFKGLPGSWELFELDGDPIDEPVSEQLEASLRLTASDRFQVQFVRQAPGLARSLARVATRTGAEPRS